MSVTALEGMREVLAQITIVMVEEMITKQLVQEKVVACHQITAAVLKIILVVIAVFMDAMEELTTIPPFAEEEVCAKVPTDLAYVILDTVVAYVMFILVLELIVGLLKQFVLEKAYAPHWIIALAAQVILDRSVISMVVMGKFTTTLWHVVEEELATDQTLVLVMRVILEATVTATTVLES